MFVTCVDVLNIMAIPLDTGRPSVNVCGIVIIHLLHLEVVPRGSTFTHRLGFGSDCVSPMKFVKEGCQKTAIELSAGSLKCSVSDGPPVYSCFVNTFMYMSMLAWANF